MKASIKAPFKYFLQGLFALPLFFLIASCGDDPDTEDPFRSDRCNMGQRATLSLDITGVGVYTFTESATAISHATDTEGSGIDALSMYIYWTDPVSGDSLAFDVTVENEVLAPATTYTYDNTSFNGSVNFYIYSGGALQQHYTFNDWTTTVTDFEEYRTTSAGGYTTTRLAFIDAMTTGTLRQVGSSNNFAFTSTYTICPQY